VRIYGLDFTSAPGRRKPLIVLGCALEGDSLRAEHSETLTDFGGFEDFLQRSARETLLAGLESAVLREVYGFAVEMDASWRDEFVRDPSADALDSLLRAVQAVWAYEKRDEGYGVPPECDPDEGWILDPALLDE
jgi:hypothetical protein